MGMILRRIALENFRKFRKRHEIAELADGLNVIVEPNETGKSTVMEAVRAALFLRHGSKTSLIQSFQPYGDSVAPQVELDFEIDGAPYRLVKRFLSKQVAELEGPDGRKQGDAAEEALQTLLGFDKQSTRYDAGALGTLGLLWVPQTEGLHLPSPGDRVREGIGGALEEQAGAILGSKAFERVCDRIEAQFDRFKTPTGRAKGELKEAEANLEEAAQALQKAELQEAALEQAYSDYGRAKGELQLAVGDLSDDGEAENKRKLSADLDLAKVAAQKLETEQARHSSAQDRVTRLEELSARHDNANDRVGTSEVTLKQIYEKRADLAENLAKAKSDVTNCGEDLKAARAARSTARTALDDARKREARRRERSDIERARERHVRLLEFEQQQAELVEAAQGEVPSETLEVLEALDAKIAREQATFEAGGVRVEYHGSASVTLDGVPMPEGATTLTKEAHIGFSDGGELVVHPPSNLAGAAARLASTKEKRKALLDDLDADTLAELRSRDREARDATAKLVGITGQIETLTAADEALDLAAGPEALKLYIAEHPEEAEPAEKRSDEGSSLAEREEALEASETALVRAEERNDAVIEALRLAEKEDSELALQEGNTKIERDCAKVDVAEIEASPEFAELSDKLAEARAELLRRANELEKAEHNAAALDVAAIEGQIATLERHRQKTGERKSELEREVARLEARVETEGGRGLAERAATARDDEKAARAALDRIRGEAETLTVLRDVLVEAREEMSRSLIGPVAQRAQKYTRRILPSSDPVFGSQLQLATIRRGGLEEEFDLLSKGTQEQLSMLSRLAYAELLRDEGYPVSLMLDDPLAYSDDYRLNAMINLLDEFARDIQVIVLTCRERAFRAAPGNRISLS